MVELLAKKFEIFKDRLMNVSGNEPSDAKGIDGGLLKGGDIVGGLGNES